MYLAGFVAEIGLGTYCPWPQTDLLHAHGLRRAELCEAVHYMDTSDEPWRSACAAARAKFSRLSGFQLYLMEPIPARPAE